MPDPQLHKLWIERKQISAEGKDIIREAKKEDRGLNPSEKRNVDEKIEKLNEINEKIDRILKGGDDSPDAREAFKGVEMRDRLDGRGESGAPSVHTTSESDSDMSNDNPNLDRETREAFDRFVRTGESRKAEQSISSAGAGGVFSSTQLAESFFAAQDAFGGVRDLSISRFRTETGRDIKRPVIPSPDAKGEIVGENSTIASTTAISMDSINLTAHTYQSGPITISREQAQDSGQDIADIVIGRLRQRAARAAAEDFAASTATSSTAPIGLASPNVSTGGVSMTAGSSNLTLDILRQMRDSLDPAYRANAEIAVSDSFLDSLLSLEDSDGRPLIEPDLQRRGPEQFLGHEIITVQNLGDVNTSSQVPALIGDFSGYAVRDVNRVEIQRLEERYAEFGQIGFIARMRTDARPLYSTQVSPEDRPVRALVTT